MDLLGRVREDFGIPLIGVRPTGLGADARAAQGQDPADRADALRIAAGALSPEGLVTITLSEGTAGH